MFLLWRKLIAARSFKRSSRTSKGEPSLAIHSRLETVCPLTYFRGTRFGSSWVLRRYTISIPQTVRRIARSFFFRSIITLS